MLNELFRAYINTEPVKAVGYTREALSLAEQGADEKGKAACYNILGVAYRNQGALDVALGQDAHALSSQFFLPLESLSLKKVGRHGGDGTVDVASHGIKDDDYSYGSGATIRFVAMMDPEKGPVARNVIPGGQVFDPRRPVSATPPRISRPSPTCNVSPPKPTRTRS